MKTRSAFVLIIIFTILVWKCSSQQATVQNIQNSIKNNFVEDSLQPTITPPINKITSKNIIENNSNDDIKNQLSTLNLKMDELQGMMMKIINLLEKDKIETDISVEDKSIL